VVTDLADWLKDRNLLTKLIQQQLLRAQQRMKHQADSKRSEREFSVGDMVYLKLQPHIQTSVADRSNYKLSFRYYGPYKVLQQIGAVAYKLDLHPESHIHLVVHVSLRKQHVPPQLSVSTDLSSVASDASEPAAPLLILDRQLKLCGGSAMPRLLVHWNSVSQFQTWEDETDLRCCFPDAPAWGQAAL